MTQDLPLEADRPWWPDRGRIPSLDGLRGVAIALVVAYHAANAAAQARARHDYDGPLRLLVNGELGVDVFFVLSGFLITLLLTREQDATGRVDLVQFYVRRTFRIWPALFAYLATIVALHELRLVGIGPRDVVAAATFSFNYVPRVGNPWVGQTWSLAVEEHFYLLWPAVLIALGRRGAAVVAVALIAALPVVRYAEVRYLPWRSLAVTRLWETSHTRADTLMYGCLFALVARHRGVRAALDRAFARGLPVAAALWAVFGIDVLRRTVSVPVQMALGYSLQAAAVTVVLAWAVRRPTSAVGRVLNSRPLVGLGNISYSLYLWNVPFCLPQDTAWFGRWPWNAVASVAVAAGSYFGVERPFLALRARLFPGRRQPPTPAALAAA